MKLCLGMISGLSRMARTDLFVCLFVFAYSIVVGRSVVVNGILGMRLFLSLFDSVPSLNVLHPGNRKFGIPCGFLVSSNLWNYPFP